MKDSKKTAVSKISDKVVESGNLIMYCFNDMQDAYIAAKLIPKECLVFTLLSAELVRNSTHWIRSHECNKTDITIAGEFNYVVGYVENKKN